MLERLLKVIGNYKNLVKTELDVKSESAELEPMEFTPASRPCDGSTSCYLPQTAFQKPGGGLLTVGECKEGSQVLASDGRQVQVLASERLPPESQSSVICRALREGDRKLASLLIRF